METIDLLIKEITEKNLLITEYQEIIFKLSLNILTIISINLKGDLGVNNEKFSLYISYLLINNDRIQKVFFVTFCILYQLLEENSPIKKIIFTTIEKYIFNTETLEKSNGNFIIHLFENILFITEFSKEEKLKYLKNILKINSDLLLLKYLRPINILINTLSEKEKIEICEEPNNLLDKLINKYLLEDTSNKYIYPECSSIIFNIINTLTRNCSENLIKFFTNEKIQNILNYISSIKDTKEFYNPQSSKREKILLIGIINLRNICYLISIIQQFFNITPFKFGLLKARDNKKKNPDENISDDNLLHQLQKLFTYLQISHRNYVNPKDFVYSFKDLDNQPTDINIQCDAQEFLSRFMDKIEFSLSKTKFKYLMKSIFIGETCSQLICSKCNSIRNRFEELYFLSLEMRNMNKISQCLDKYINEDLIDDFFCEKCNKKNTHIKKNSISKLPNILFIHLQRFSFNYENFQMEKINSTLEFSRRINLKKYCTETINNNNNEILKDDFEFNNKVYNHLDNYYKYKLKGIVVHSGTSQFGHYYSFINTNMSDLNDNSWLKFDDAIVTKYDIKKLKEDTFGGDFKERNEYFPAAHIQNAFEENSKSAYILVYERDFKSPILQLVDYENLENNNNLENINNNISDNNNCNLENIRDNNINDTEINNKINIESNNNNNINKNNFKVIDIGDNYDLFYKNIDPFKVGNEGKNTLKLDCEANPLFLNENSQDNIIYKFKNEYFQYTPYYNLNVTNVTYEEEYFDEVKKDNIYFRNDINIFNAFFINFINSLINNLISEINFSEEKFSEEVLLKIIKSIHHILVDILTKIINKTYLNNIIIQIIEIIKIKPFITKVILEEILKDKEYYIFKLILTLDDKLNSPFQNYFTESIRYALTYDSQEFNYLINETLDYLLSLIPIEISKNWTKMISFLDIFDRLLNLNNNREIHKKIVKLFYEKNVISKFGDFFLGKDSPLIKLGDNRNEIGNKTVNPKFAPLINVISVLTRYSYNFVNQKSPLSLFFEGEDFYLNDNDKLILNSNKFYQKAIKENYHNQAISLLISHLMYNDIEFTNKRIYSIVNMINNSSNSNEIKETLDLISNILLLEDKYSFYRFESIIGLPQIQFKLISNRFFNFHNNLNTNNKIIQIDNQQNIKFISTLFPNEETIFEKMFNRWKNNIDFINCISKIYTLLFISPLFFRYFNSLPHPKNFQKKLSDFLEENSKEEIHSINNCSMKKYMGEIIVVENYIDKYDIKEFEVKEKFNNDKEWNINFLPRKNLGNVAQEIITNIKVPLCEENNYEDPNDYGIYLLRCDMDIIIGDFIIQKQVKKENSHNYYNENNNNNNNNNDNNNVNDNKNYKYEEFKIEGNEEEKNVNEKEIKGEENENDDEDNDENNVIDTNKEFDIIKKKHFKEKMIMKTVMNKKKKIKNI